MGTLPPVPRLPFRPSRDGFAFTNSWPSEPAVTIATPFGDLAIGNASAGLCGGMVFAALDHWYAGRPAPVERPGPGTPTYRFIVRRLIDSWHVPAGVAQYYAWMCLPDHDLGFSAFGHDIVAERGLTDRTISQQWPQIRADLDREIPCALGLVTVASHRPADLALNHQVLACGYTVDGSRVTITVYDPNSGQDDDVSISFEGSAAEQPTPFSTNIAIGHPVRGFFRTSYRPVAPPAAQKAETTR